MSTLLQEIEAQIAGVKAGVAKHNVGTVREIGDGVAKVEGLTDAMLNEMLDFGNGVTGLALNLEEMEVGAIILGDYTGIKEGQEVLVQIAKEPIGKKGARITSHIALPGRFMVYMPAVNHIGVSRKIASEEERQRLKRIVMAERNGHGGFIVRKNACACSGSQSQSEGCGNCGTHTRTCDGCSWGGWGDCTGQGACAKGQTEEQACGDCGKHSRTCNDSCGWGDFGACSGADPGDACETGKPGGPEGC